MTEADGMVFVVDDDAAMRQSLGSLLRSVGLRVELFASAHDFLRCTPPNVPGCLVLDVRLPSLSGLDLQKRMAEANLDIPIVFITAHGDIPMTVRAMKDGAVEFLAKPFRDQDLLDAIQLGLERARRARAQRTENEELQGRYLSGHERGAFTGALLRRVGRFELTNDGTLILDEIGDVPLELQPKLLRVLEEQEFERLGSTQTIRVSVRLIAATNVELATMVAEKGFRRDLYYRLNVFPLVIPPLRDRREDIPALVDHFIRTRVSSLNKRFETISPSALEALMDYAGLATCASWLTL